MTEVGLLELRGLRCRFASRGIPLIAPGTTVHAVDGVDLTIAPGEILGLVGESGCGKSTLAKALMGLGDYQAETMRFAGQDIRAPLYRRPRDLLRRIQYVFQDPLDALDPRRSVLYQVAEPLLIHGLASGGEREARARAALRDVNLGEDIEAKFPHQLSGGQRQRVVIARALVLAPEVLICDEPVSALDVSIQAQVVNLLRDLRDRRALTILFISHDLGLVRHLCDRVAVMYLGRICETGPIGPLFERPRHPYTQALVAAIPPPHPRLRKPPKRLIGEPPRPGSPPPGCRFHPRCPLCEAACRTEPPALLPIVGAQRVGAQHVGVQQSVACHVARRGEALPC